MAIIVSFIAADQFVDCFGTSPKLVSHRHHTKRRMVAEFIQNAESFFGQVFLACPVITFFAFGGKRPPERQLGFVINTKQVSGKKSGFRRAAGVAAVMVDTELFRFAHNSQPAGKIHRGIAGQREDHTVMLTAQKCFAAVDHKVHAARFKFTDTAPYGGRVAMSVFIRE